ncbi:MAG: hypothetical protein AAGJ38_00430 [Planctomycetota bacterium]
MIERWDWAVITIYLLLMLAIGWWCRRLNGDSSDYFRGGGQMLWWVSGSSMLISSISLWTFSAAGIRVYQTGFYQVIAYFVVLPGIPLLYLFFAARFRRMRAITTADAIRRRYGRTSEQVWVWITVPINLFYSGLALHTIAIFIGAATGAGIHTAVALLGLIITVMVLIGGAWAVSMSDVLQGLIVVLIAFIVLIRTFMLPEVGGAAGFWKQLPPEFTDFNLWSRPMIWMPWLITQGINGILRVANINDYGSYYLKVKNERHAKWQTILIAFTPLLPLIVFLPIMASVWVIPDLEALFPNLERPAEGAYIAIAMHVLPPGMVGLLICAIFAVQMSSLDTGLNKSAGFFVCNFYRDLLRRDASERELVWAGMAITLLFGATIVTIGLLITSYRELDLFQFTLVLATVLQVPLLVPMVAGTVVRRTPGWSAWSTVIVGVAVGASTNYVWLREPETVHGFASAVGYAMPMNTIETNDLRFMVGWLAVMGSTIAWFALTRLFWSKTAEDFRAAVHAFFEDLNTPLGSADPSPAALAVDAQQDAVQFRLVGQLCLLFGVPLTLGVLIPNEPADRALFLLLGGCITGVGALLLWLGRRRLHRIPAGVV